MKETSVINKPVDDNTPEPRQEPPKVDSGCEPFRLQPDTELENATSYTLTDLLSYHDKTFVLNAYAAIAKRPPSPSELTQALQELRGGRRSKTEIIEQLSAKYPGVRVDGLGSPALRGLSGWPVVGYVLKVLRAIARLPLLVQHQQQFESYIVGQQQRMADHFNDQFLTGTTRSDLSMRESELAENVSDAIKTVMMLSDSLIELSANLAEGETRLQTQQERAESEFRNNLAALREHLATSIQQLQTELTTSARQIQKRQEQSETQLHSDLVALTTQLTTQQERLDEMRRVADRAATAQREFLIDEQRIIVEAQRAAITDLETQFAQTLQQQAAKIEALTAELDELRPAIKDSRPARLHK